MGNWFSDTWKDLTQPGWKQAEKAQKSNDILQQQSTAQNATALSIQKEAEDFKRAQARDMESLALDMLYGRTTPGPARRPMPTTTGPESGTSGNGQFIGNMVKTGNQYSDAGGQMDEKTRATMGTYAPTPDSSGGAINPAEDWMAKYLDYQQNSPDTTYNLQSSQLARQTATAKDNLNKTMARRGMTISGLAAGDMAGLDMQQGRENAQLLGQREDRRGQRLNAGMTATQAMLNRALNMYSGAKGAQMNLNTQLPGMYSNQAANSLNQRQEVPQVGPGIIQRLGEAYIKSQTGGLFSSGQAGTLNGEANPFYVVS